MALPDFIYKIAAQKRAKARQGWAFVFFCIHLIQTAG